MATTGNLEAVEKILAPGEQDNTNKTRPNFQKFWRPEATSKSNLKFSGWRRVAKKGRFQQDFPKAC